MVRTAVRMIAPAILAGAAARAGNRGVRIVDFRLRGSPHFEQNKGKVNSSFTLAESVTSGSFLRLQGVRAITAPDAKLY
jgi:hypothetical protein